MNTLYGYLTKTQGVGIARSHPAGYASTGTEPAKSNRALLCSRPHSCASTVDSPPSKAPTPSRQSSRTRTPHACLFRSRRGREGDLILPRGAQHRFESAVPVLGEDVTVSTEEHPADKHLQNSRGSQDDDYVFFGADAAVASFEREKLACLLCRLKVCVPVEGRVHA